MNVKDRLIAVSSDLFSRRGYEAVSVREITTRAKANLGAITYHFGSKEALYHAAIESLIEPFVAAIAQAGATAGSALDRVEAIVRAALQHLARKPSAPAILLRELLNDRPLPPPLQSAMRRNVSILAGVITDGQRDGTIRAGNPVLLSLSVIAQPFYFRIASRGIQQALGIDVSDAAAWSGVVDHVALGVRHTIANHPPKKTI